MLALMLVSTASALVEMKGFSSGAFEPKQISRCYNDAVSKRFICEGALSYRISTANSDSSNQCYMDPRYGAVCPKPDQKKEKQIIEEYREQHPPLIPRITKPVSLSIHGSFEPRFDMRFPQRRRLDK